METRQTPIDDSTTVDMSRLESPRAKLVLFYLRVREAATADELARSLDMRLTELFPVLDGLRRKGLVAREENRFAPA